jgi:sulfonate transport system substrate-binding protein
MTDSDRSFLMPAAPRRRAWLKGTAALALSASLGMAGTRGAHARADAKTLRIGYQKYGTLVILKARGTLEKRLAASGVRVEWTEFPAGPQLLEALNAGAVDVGTVGETPTIFALAGGVDFVYVAHEPPAPKGEAIVVASGSPLSRVEDLRGKRVALNRGSNVHFLLARALGEAKLGFSDIETVYLAPADARAAFTQGSVDAWVIWDPYLSAIQVQTGARVLRDGTGLVDNTQFYLAARRFAESRPQWVRALLDELAGIDAWAQNHSSDIARELAPVTGLDVASLDLAARRASYGVHPVDDATLRAQQRVADTFSSLRLIPKRLDVSSARWRA